MSPQELQRLQKERKQNTSTQYDTVAIVGLGYVGLPLAILASEQGFNTIGFDIDQKKVAKLKKKNADFLSEEESVAFGKVRTLEISDEESALDAASIFIICVPTPVFENHEPDLRPLESASEAVGRHMRRGALVVIESTVNPGVCESIALPILEKVSGLSKNDFYFAHCPERINPGDQIWNVRTIPRVIGGRTRESLERATKLYRTLINAQIIQMQSIKEAEAVKMVENSFRDINIAFVNELAMAFDKAGIDIVNVIRGASSKPFAFMPHYPGCGVGGHCIPVDPYYLIRYGAQNGFNHLFLATARRINEQMPRYTVDLLERALSEKSKPLQGAKIALLGLAYKKDVPDLRESPALEIEKILSEKGAEVLAYDPFVTRIQTSPSLEHALSKADAVVIATDHTLFRALRPEQFTKAGISIVIDGRNCLDKQAFVASGIAYRGIGRPRV